MKCICVCEQCGKSFAPKVGHYQRFCSRACFSQHRRRAPTERFWEKVDRSGGDGSCWEWMAGTNHKGYGSFSIGHARVELAHRVSWRLANGPIPGGQYVLHSCDNPRCFNPRHLFLGSLADNVRDMCQKGRSCRGAAHPHSKLNAEAVRQIWALRADDHLSIRAIARKYGVCPTTIRQIFDGVAWKHVNIEPSLSGAYVSAPAQSSQPADM